MDKFNEEDVRLFELLKNSEYYAVIDNDIIMVQPKECYECFGNCYDCDIVCGDNSFSSYGLEFIYSLLKHLKIDVEYC